MAQIQDAITLSEDNTREKLQRGASSFPKRMIRTDRLFHFK